MDDPITWKRLRAIFGDPKPVQHVTERQFDYNDAILQQLGATPYDEIDFGDLWYYHHDLSYVELQPELFNYLFPVCLMDWHRSLLANEACSHGDSEFHRGIVTGNVLGKMLTEQQRVAVNQVFIDSMLYRLDQERLLPEDVRGTTFYGWIARLNSLGIFFDQLPEIWQHWWKIETVGHAICVMEYCSALMYFYFDNPVLRPIEGWSRGGPYLWVQDSQLLDRGWSECNVEFIRNFLTLDRVKDAIFKTSEILEGQAEGSLARKLKTDLDGCSDLIASRIAELPALLASGDYLQDWTV